MARLGEGSRSTGVDVARAVALLGIMAVHIFPPLTSGGSAHPAFLLDDGDDLDATAVRLEGLGFTVDRTEEHTFPGYRRLHTADGNGNRVELLASP